MREEVVAKLIIPGCPVSKKNHNQVVMVKGRPVVLPSKPYMKYRKDAKPYLIWKTDPIDYPVNVQCRYFMATRRRCDLVNLLQCSLDILVENGILKDDNYTIAYSYNGSEVQVDKAAPRAEITITRIELFVRGDGE